MNKTDTADEWTYEFFDRYRSPSEFGPFQSLVALWRSKWRGEALPAWRDFEFKDFVGWHGWLIVEDVIPGGNGDVRFRLWGTEVTELFQIELTGKCMSEVGNDWFDPQEFELVTRVVEESVIAVSTGSLAWEGRGHMVVSTIEIPLAGDGETVDKILVGVRQIE